MRIVIGLLVVSAAAACGDDGSGLPVGGNGNDGGFQFIDGNNNGGNDAHQDAANPDSLAAPIDANLFDGRVCLLTDTRILDVCASTGAGGLSVRIGTSSATTADDGSFKIEGQTGADLVWRITGPNIVSSFEPLKDYFIPAITKTAFAAMKSGSSPSVMEVPGEGSVILFISYNGAGASGHTVTSVPEGFYKPYYDGSTPSSWQQSLTGTNGAAWIPGVDVGTVEFHVDGSTDPTQTITAPVFDGGITFANLILQDP